MENTKNKDEKNLSPQESLQLISKMMDKVRDDKLWKIAKKRATFKMILVVYIIMNLVLVALWYYTSGPGTHFWPIWPILGWGLGLLFQFVDAYWSNTLFSEEKEFEKLKKKQ